MDFLHHSSASPEPPDGQAKSATTARQCGGASPFIGTNDVTAAQVQSIFNGGPNNNANYTSTLTNLFINGANETAATPYNATLLNTSFVTAPYVAGNFTQTNYVGAVRDGNDIWYRGWTCDSGYASFSSGNSCNTVPA